jgi:hypothetical protein
MKKKSIGSNIPSPGAVRSQRTLKLPALLFEGDQDLETESSSDSEKQSKPGARLGLMPRDPHTVYAHWELTPAQTRQFSTSPIQSSLFLNVHREHAEGPLAARVSIAPESNHAFVHLTAAGMQYVAELGYFDRTNQWVPLARSIPVITPPETVSMDRTVQFAEMPAAVSRYGSRSPAPPAAAGRERAVETKKAVDEATASEQGVGVLIPPPSVSWIPALPDKREFPGERVSEINYLPDLLISSAELMQRGSTSFSREETSSSERGAIDLEQLLRTTFEQLKVGNSSPLGDAPAISSSFFLTVETELLVHGATHPDAQVMVSGTPIQLRPDGTFTYRFALPEGEVGLTVEAISIEGDLRRADLKVSRECK